jgi:hypothetical protein
MNTSKRKSAWLVGLALIVTLSATPALSQNMGGMKMDMKMTGPMAPTTGYRFELAAPPKSAGAGKSIVSIRLVHGGKPVGGAIIIQSRADMEPAGMAAHTAPIKPIGEKPPGTYSFMIDNGAVWKKPDDWAVGFSAKVQGVAQTVTGKVTVKLQP